MGRPTQPRFELARELQAGLPRIFGTHDNARRRLALKDGNSWDFPPQYYGLAVSARTIPRRALQILLTSWDTWRGIWLRQPEGLLEEEYGMYWYDHPEVDYPFTLPKVRSPDPRPIKIPALGDQGLAYLDPTIRKFALALFGKYYIANDALGLQRHWGRDLWAGRQSDEAAVRLVETQWQKFCHVFLQYHYTKNNYQDAFADDYWAPGGQTPDFPDGLVKHFGEPEPFTLIFRNSRFVPDLAGVERQLFEEKYADQGTLPYRRTVAYQAEQEALAEEKLRQAEQDALFASQEVTEPTL